MASFLESSRTISTTKKKKQQLSPDQLLSNTTVIDLGSHSIKFGFAGDDDVTARVPSYFAEAKNPFPEIDDDDSRNITFFEDRSAFKKTLDSEENREAFRYSNLFLPSSSSSRILYEDSGYFVQDWDAMERLWHFLESTYLHSRPGDDFRDFSISPILLLAQKSLPSRINPETGECLAALKEDQVRFRDQMKKMTEILFETFSIPGLFIESPLTTNLYGVGADSGISVDIGHKSTRSGVVTNGKLDNSSCLIEPSISGDALKDNFIKILLEGGKSLDSLMMLSRDFHHHCHHNRPTIFASAPVFDLFLRERCIHDTLLSNRRHPYFMCSKDGIEENLKEELRSLKNSESLEKSYHLPDQQPIKISSCDKLLATENTFFPRSHTNSLLHDVVRMTLTDFICSSIVSIPTNGNTTSQQQSSSSSPINVVLGGGASLVSHLLKERIVHDLAMIGSTHLSSCSSSSSSTAKPSPSRHHLEYNHVAKKLFAKELATKFGSANSSNSSRILVRAIPDRDMSSWMGGSILGSLSTFGHEMMIVKRDYEEQGGFDVIEKRCDL